MRALLALALAAAAGQCSTVETAIQRPPDTPEFVATTECVPDGWTVTVTGTRPEASTVWHVIVGYDFVSDWTSDQIVYESPVVYWPDQPATNIPMTWKVDYSTDPAVMDLVTVDNPGCP